MNAVIELERLGYTFTVEGGNIRYKRNGPSINPDAVYSLLAALRSNKAELVAYLTTRSHTDPIPAMEPEWEGTTVEINNLPAFKARYGLKVARIEWPKGAAPPIAYLAPATGLASSPNRVKTEKSC